MWLHYGRPASSARRRNSLVERNRRIQQSFQGASRVRDVDLIDAVARGALARRRRAGRDIAKLRPKLAGAKKALGVTRYDAPSEVLSLRPVLQAWAGTTLSVLPI
jgi:hypothetical protein